MLTTQIITIIAVVIVLGVIIYVSTAKKRAKNPDTVDITPSATESTPNITESTESAPTPPIDPSEGNTTLPKEPAPAPTPTPTPVVTYFSIKHRSSGKCIHPAGDPFKAPEGPGNFWPNDVNLVLHSGCNEEKNKFEFTPKGHLKHKQSGRCITYKQFGVSNIYKDGTELALPYYQGGMTEDDQCIEFEHLPNGAFKNKNTNQCIHPKGGKTNPSENTILVFWGGTCDLDRITYDFI